MFIYNIDLPKKMRGNIIDERDLIKKNLNGVQFEENIKKNCRENRAQICLCDKPI